MIFRSVKHSTKILCWLLCVPVAACIEHSKDAIHSADIRVDAEETLKYLHDLLKKDAENPELYYRMARVYLAQADYDQALKNAQQATGIDQDNAEYHYLTGKAYQTLNKPEQALESFLLAERLGKKSQELYKHVAETYLKLGEAGKAREAINRLTNMNKSSEAYTLKGDIMLSLADTAFAIENYLRAARIDTERVKPFIALADISIARKNEDEAFHYVNKLLKLEPDNAEFLVRKGNLLQRTGRLDSAKQLFRTIAATRGDFMDLYRLSNVYYMLRQYDSAQYMAREAFQENESFLNARLIIARSLDRTGKYRQAIEVYENILTVDSTFVLAAKELDDLRRKVAYLWRLRQQRQAALDSVKNNPPAPVEKKEIENNQNQLLK